MKQETVKYDSLGFRVFVGTVITAVIVVVVSGLWLAGSPKEERARRFDMARLSSLQSISNAIDQYYNVNNVLPPDLETLAKARETFYVDGITDPETQAPYEYVIRGTNVYDLCATFATDASDPAIKRAEPYGLPENRFWEHKAERTCFNITARVYPK